MLFSLLLQFSDLAERHFLEKVEFFEESAESIVEIGRAHRAASKIRRVGKSTVNRVPA